MTKKAIEKCKEAVSLIEGGMPTAAALDQIGLTKSVYYRFLKENSDGQDSAPEAPRASRKATPFLSNTNPDGTIALFIMDSTAAKSIISSLWK